MILCLDGKFVAMLDNYPQISENPRYDQDSEMSFCGGISRILFCPMVLCLDGEIAWSSLDHHTLIEGEGRFREA